MVNGEMEYNASALYRSTTLQLCDLEYNALCVLEYNALRLSSYIIFKETAQAQQNRCQKYSP